MHAYHRHRCYELFSKYSGDNDTVKHMSSHYLVKKTNVKKSPTKHIFLDTSPISFLLRPACALYNSECFDVLSASNDRFLVSIIFFQPTIWFMLVLSKARRMPEFSCYLTFEITTTKIWYLVSVPLWYAVWYTTSTMVSVSAPFQNPSYSTPMVPEIPVIEAQNNRGFW